MKKEETVDYYIKATWLAISKMYNQAAQEHGITMSMGAVLLNIHPEEGTRATQIGPQIGLESTSLARMLQTLEEKALIVRKSDPEDGRAVRVFLTEKGHWGRKIAKNTVIGFNDLVRDKLTKSEHSTFFQVMKKINQIINTI